VVLSELDEIRVRFDLGHSKLLRYVQNIVATDNTVDLFGFLCANYFAV
jgi:hypothetical protein